MCPYVLVLFQLSSALIVLVAFFLFSPLIVYMLAFCERKEEVLTVYVLI